ncbi:MAG: hypothetical protein RL338_1636 [Chloroflexota bacterium]
MSGADGATPRIAPFPAGLEASGSAGAPWRSLATVAELPPGTMRRATVGDLDLLLVHDEDGLLATDDRCPHMAAPLSIGELEGCEIACPLHMGRFDLRSGEAVTMPTTGGLGPDGTPHPVWTPAGREVKTDPPGKKADARRLTRIRRLRYYPVRVVDGRIEVAVP